MGKSLSLLIPITIEKLTRRFSGCRVFVLPYAFLKDSAHEAFQTKLHQFKDYLDIQSYAASSITDSSLPFPLTNDNPPDILLLTVDAAANLIQYHPSLLRTWHATRALRGVWFDEIQCLFDEYGFRQVYQKLPLYASIGAPVTLLSGSFPYELVESTMKYLKLLPENESLESNVDVVKSKDLVGSGFRFEVIVVNNIIADTIDLMKDFCSNTGQSAHALCASKENCKEFGEILRDSSDVEVVHADLSSEAQSNIAKKWYHQEFTKLFSTSIGIVGNENPNVGCIFAVGILHSLSNLLQGCGRLRPGQRGLNAKVVQIIQTNDLQANQKLTADGDCKRNQLLQAGLLKDRDVTIFNKVFHIDGYKEFLKTDGCYLARLQKIFTGNDESPCRSGCTWCITKSRYIIHNTVQGVEQNQRPTLVAPSRPRQPVENPYNQRKRKSPIPPITMAASAARDSELLQLDQRSRADKILTWLKVHCPRCKVRGCIGECNNKACHICGSQRHLLRNCSFKHGTEEARKLDQFLKNNRICAWCFGRMNTEKHGPLRGGRQGESQCTLQKRLRCAIQMEWMQNNQNMSYGDFVKKLHCNEQSYYEFLACLDIDISAATR